MRKAILALVSVFVRIAEVNAGYEQWHNSDNWNVAGDATLNPDNRGK